MCVRRLGATRLVFYELPGVRWLHIQNPGTTTNTGRRVSALLCALGSVVLRAHHSSGFPLCSCVLGYRRPQGAGLWASFAPFSIVMQLLQESFLENNTPPKKGGKKEKKKKSYVSSQNVCVCVIKTWLIHSQAKWYTARVPALLSSACWSEPPW